MYCTNCGQPRADTATACLSCGHRVARFGAPPEIPNYLMQSILVTLCCCVPLGIPAIVFASQVNSKLAAGDIAGASESSKKAKLWSWIAFGAGALIGLLYAAVGIIGALADH
jgi:hypothetical protein